MTPLTRFLVEAGVLTLVLILFLIFTSQDLAPGTVHPNPLEVQHETN